MSDTMKVKELIKLLEKEDKEKIVVLNFPSQKGFILCPVGQVEEIETDNGDKFIMLSGLEYETSLN